jgi:hypothetical protein
VTKNLFVVVVLALAGSSSLVGQSKPSIQGVWRGVEVTITDPNVQYDSLPKGTHTNLRPSLLIFTDKHYSMIADAATKPRPTAESLKVAGKPTPEELVAMWGPFAANAGTYELSGNTLTRHTIVAKNPSVQGEKYFVRYTITLDGNNLTMVGTETQAGKTAYPSTFKYVRVE